MKQLLALILTYFSITAGSNAATITKDESNNYGCTVSLNGVLTSGDSEAIKPLLYETYEISLSDDGRYGETLCLNSPGGDLNEGIKIANYVSEYFTNTVIPSNARCESSCAVIFLASRNPLIDPAGTIGLHAPKLMLPKGDFTEKDVEKAYDLSVYTIREIMKMPTFPPAAVRYMMSTPFSEMYVPQTLFELSELGVHGQISSGLPTLPIYEVMENACRWVVWAELSGDYFVDPMARRMEFVEFTKVDLNSDTISIEGELSVHDGEETYYPCKVVLRYSERYSDVSASVIILEKEHYVSGAKLYSPGTSYLEADRLPKQSIEQFAKNIKSLGVRTPKEEDKRFITPQCFISSSTSIIKNVQNFTNLRRQAGLKGQVIGQVPLGATVSIVNPGSYLRTNRCASPCDGNNQSLIDQCIDDNEVWIEVQYNGRRGFLSRKFLE